MALPVLLPLLTAVLPKIGEIIQEAIPDKDLAKRLEADLTMKVLANSHELEKSAADIIVAEAKSEHWLTATWRPILMLTITAIVAYNYLLAPLFGGILIAAGYDIPLSLELPAQLWTMLTVGVGGYVVGRSGEKIAEQIKWNGPRVK